MAYHRRAADLLTATPEAVATHAAAVGDQARAARAWLLAGERARRTSADDAVALLTRALDAASQAEDPELAGRAHFARGGRARHCSSSDPRSTTTARRCPRRVRQATAGWR